MAGVPTLVFDLDGTLVDTVADLVAALNATLAGEGLQPVATERARPMVGNGARAMLEAAIIAGEGAASAERLDRLTATFIDHYAAHIADHSQPFPGTVASLDRLAAEGWRLAVCTNKLERLSRLLLGKLALADRFAAIAGQDTFGVRKPDPRHLTETIARAGGSIGSALMVGDSGVDVATARAAGIPVIAVSFGYTMVPARELGADTVIDHFDELYHAVGLLRQTGRKLPGRREDMIKDELAT